MATPLDRRRLALLGFTGHVFGLWFAGHRLGARWTGPNRVALGLTAVGMALGGLAMGAWGVLWAWLLGHFAWSAILARAVLRGEAGFPAERA